MSKKLPAVFLDRDGTILKHRNYLRELKNVKLYKNAPYALKMLKKNGYKLVIITNQSAVGRGFLTLKKLYKIHKKMLSLLKKKGAVIDGIYFCPHHPDENCVCRKPRTGLIKKAAKELNIDVKKSYFIGDNETDVQTAKNAGMKAGLLVLTGLGKKQSVNALKFKDLLQATKWILKNSR